MKNKSKNDFCLTKEIIYIIIVLLGVLYLLCGCSTHIYKMDPNIGYVDEDQMGMFICRFTAEGTKICEKNLDFYKRKNQTVYTVPAPGNTWE